MSDDDDIKGCHDLEEWELGKASIEKDPPLTPSPPHPQDQANAVTFWLKYTSFQHYQTNWAGVDHPSNNNMALWTSVSSTYPCQSVGPSVRWLVILLNFHCPWTFLFNSHLWWPPSNAKEVATVTKEVDTITKEVAAITKLFEPKCIFPKCNYPKCIFAKCTRLACLLSFASLLAPRVSNSSLPPPLYMLTQKSTPKLYYLC